MTETREHGGAKGWLTAYGPEGAQCYQLGNGKPTGFIKMPISYPSGEAEHCLDFKPQPGGNQDCERNRRHRVTAELRTDHERQ